MVREKTTTCNLSPSPCRQGLVQIFTGDGRGKTSAALGTVLRALGHGLRVYIVFFMKGQYPYGERETLRKLADVTVASFGLETFCDPQNIKQEEIEQAEQALNSAREAMLSGKYDILVLDEVNVAVFFKLVSIEKVIQLIQDKPESMELILTGRKADPRLIEKADLVTEMVKIKHPYDKGISARQGIEY